MRNQLDGSGLIKQKLTKEQPLNSSTYNQRVIENGTYVPYSPYALRRREMMTRPFSPPINRDSGDTNNERSYSPYRQYIEQNRCTNGQSNTTTDTRPYSPYLGRFEERDGSNDRWQNAPRSLSPFTRDYSPWRRENVDPPGVVQPLESGRYSPFVQQRIGQYHPTPQPQTHPPSSHEIYASPMISRKRFPSEPPPVGSHGSTSPQPFISRFTNQTKQDNTTVASQTTTPTPPSKESAKKRFASYVRLRLGGDRSASPEPPPRLSRGESPLAMRRNTAEQASPSFPRRYVSPSPPQPPPRRLSESTSVPGSPQYLRTRLRYTPEPQRKPPPPP